MKLHKLLLISGLLLSTALPSYATEENSSDEENFLKVLLLIIPFLQTIVKIIFQKLEKTRENFFPYSKKMMKMNQNSKYRKQMNLT